MPRVTARSTSHTTLRRWTSAEVERLRALAEAGASVSEIAAALSRTRAAVSGHALKLGVRVRTSTRFRRAARPAAPAAPAAAPAAPSVDAVVFATRALIESARRACGRSQALAMRSRDLAGQAQSAIRTASLIAARRARQADSACAGM
jgi:hypothetical protein